MRTFGPVALVLCCGAVLAGVQNPATGPAEGVLAAARAALGGDKKLSSVKTLVATGRTRQVRGDNLVPIEFEVALELPDKYARKDEIPAQESGPTTVGFNGDDLLLLPVPTSPPARAGGPPPPTAEQIAAARKAQLAAIKQDFARFTLGLFAASFNGYPLAFTYVGRAEAPQGKADVLDVKGPEGPDRFAARLFINAETHLPIMVTWQAPAAPMRGGPPRGGPPPSRSDVPSRSDLTPPPVPSPPGSAAASPAPASPARAGGPAAGQPPLESRLYFGEYRDVNGMQLPFRLRRAVGPDTVEETTFDGYKINAKIDPKKFEIRK